ncbi:MULTISPECIES: MFS transporter [unclassified Streptomyces]|uniref:MFS transporter n=2 Tax=Streptomyces TaxID=1883 RepID=UPI003D73FC89
MGETDVPGMTRRSAGKSPARRSPGRGGDSRRDTAVLWCVNAVDGLGSQASGLVFPLLLLNLGHGPGVAGAFAGAAGVAGLLLGPLVAVPADHGRRRALMTGSALLASLAMAGLAVSCLARPPLWVLLVAALVERLSATVFEAAARGALSRLAEPADMPRAVAGFQAGDQAALVGGPVLGGVLFAVNRSLPFVFDAVTYGLAALGTRAIRGRLDGPVPSPSSTGAEGRQPAGGATGGEATGGLRAGLVVVSRSPVLRLVLLWSTVASGALALLFYTAVFVLGEGSGSAVTGAVLAACGAAGLAGSLVAARVVRRLGARRSLTTATWLLLPPCALLSLAGDPWLWALGFGALSAVLPVVTVVLGAAAVLATPQDVQSRAGAVLGTGGAVAAAVAPAFAAALVTWYGDHAPAVCCGVVLAVLAAYTQRVAPVVIRPIAVTDDGPASGPGGPSGRTREPSGRTGERSACGTEPLTGAGELPPDAGRRRGRPDALPDEAHEAHVIDEADGADRARRAVGAREAHDLDEADGADRARRAVGAREAHDLHEADRADRARRAEAPEPHGLHEADGAGQPSAATGRPSAPADRPPTVPDAPPALPDAPPAPPRDTESVQPAMRPSRGARP